MIFNISIQIEKMNGGTTEGKVDRRTEGDKTILRV